PSFTPILCLACFSTPLLLIYIHPFLWRLRVAWPPATSARHLLSLLNDSQSIPSALFPVGPAAADTSLSPCVFAVSPSTFSPLTSARPAPRLSSSRVVVPSSSARHFPQSSP
ncbi:hypothetical protein R3P38DRAFT_3123156, partial [Favolaschia claudopus]